jgi:hypothetical protein
MQFKDSQGLFGLGIGGSTCAEIKCDVCGTIHNKGCDPDADRNPTEGDWVKNTQFAGMTVCFCCYEKIENAVLSRIDDIIPWYRDLLKAQRKILEDREKVFTDLETEKHPADCMACEHANENPAICPCPPQCYCQSNTCKNRRTQDRKNPELFKD